MVVSEASWQVACPQGASLLQKVVEAYPEVVDNPGASFPEEAEVESP